MKKTLCYLAGLGLVLGLIVHIFSLLGIYIGDKILFILTLHIGIFIVWIPAILELKKEDFNQLTLWLHPALPECINLVRKL
jgi:hypothetical protein